MRSTSKAVAWSALQSWGGQLAGFIVYAILARYLEPEAFGLIAMAMVYIAFTQLFVDQGLSVAVIQRAELSNLHLSTAFWTNVVAGLLLSGCGYFLAQTIGSFYNQPNLIPVLQTLSVLLFTNSLCSIQSAIYRRNLNFKPLALAALFSSSIGGFIGVVMAIRGFGVWSLVGQQVSASLIQICILWIKN